MTNFVDISRTARMLLIAAFGFGAVIAVIIGYQAGQQQYLVALGFVIYAAVAIVPLLLRDTAIGWFHPLVFMALWWGLARYVLPLSPVLFGGLEEHFAIPGASNEELNAIAGLGFLLSAVGLLSFYFGYQMVRPIRLGLPVFRPPHMAFVKTGIIVAISLFALMVLAREAGGLDRLLLQRGISQQLRVEIDLGGRHWHFLAGLGVYACLVWLAFAPNQWRNPGFIFLFLLSLAISFAATGSRSLVLVPILMAGAMWSLHFRKFPSAAVVVFAMFGLFFVGLGGQFRELSRGAEAVNVEDIETSFGAQIGRGVENVFRYGSEFDGLFAILANVPDKMPFLLGESYLSVGFIALPSVILPFEKPLAGGQIVSDRIFGIPDSGVPPGNIGEAYMNFHVPGVVLIMFLFGGLCRIFAERYNENSTESFDRLFYVAMLFLLQPNTTALYDWVQALIVLSFFAVVYCGLPIGSSQVQSTPKTSQ